MAQLIVGDLVVELDEDGFLEDHLVWTEDVARALGKTEEVDELTEEHWNCLLYTSDAADE